MEELANIVEEFESNEEESVPSSSPFNQSSSLSSPCNQSSSPLFDQSSSLSSPFDQSSSSSTTPTISQIDSSNSSSDRFDSHSSKIIENGENSEESDERNRKGKEELSCLIEDILEEKDYESLCQRVKKEDTKENPKSDLMNSLSSVPKEQIMKELSNLSENPDKIEKIVSSIGKNDELSKIINKEEALKLSSNPNIRKITEDAREKMTRKQALKMNKALKKGLNKNRSSEKIEGVMINIGKKVKPYHSDISNDPNEKVDLDKIRRTINASVLKCVHTLEYIIYYDLKSPSTNKVINRMFPNIELGNQIVIFRKDYSPLSVDDILKLK